VCDGIRGDRSYALGGVDHAQPMFGQSNINLVSAHHPSDLSTSGQEGFSRRFSRRDVGNG
jgi:hypothetical protein